MIDHVKIALSIDGDIQAVDRGPFRCIDYDKLGVSVDFMQRNAIEIYDSERSTLDLLLSKCQSPRNMCMQMSIYFTGGQCNFTLNEGFMSFLSSRGISLAVSIYDL